MAQIVRRVAWPMPVAIIYDHPLALSLSPAGFGSLCRLLLHFWMTDCKKLPVAKYELRGIARAHPGVWRQQEHDILQIVSDVTPVLEAFFHSKNKKRNALLNAAIKSAQDRRERSLEAKRLIYQNERGGVSELGSEGVGPKRRQDIVSESVVQRAESTVQLAPKKKEPGVGFRDV